MKRDFEYTNEELVNIARSCPTFSSPAFQLYVNDFLGSNKVLMMEPEAVSAYFFLLLASWNEKDCGIPTDDIRLVRISRLFPEIWEKVKESVLSNFFEHDGRFYNRRLLLERKKQINVRNQRYDAIRKRYEKSTGDTTKKIFPVNEDVNEIEDLKEKKKEGDIYFLAIFNQFLPPELQPVWCEYLDYCYERNDIRLNRITVIAQLKFLREHLTDAKAIMEQTIKNNWKGLFEVKNGTSKQSTGATPDELAAIVKRRFDRQKAEK